MRHLLQLMLFVLLFLAPLSGGALAQNVPSGITFVVNFRHPDGYWNRNIRAGEAVLDEMLQNAGPDSILNEFSWEQLQQTADFATHHIKSGDDLQFGDKMRAIERSMLRLTDRESVLKSLRDKIQTEHAAGMTRWKELLDGTSITEQIGIALGVKGTGMIASGTFQYVGNEISERFAIALVAGGGRVLSVAGKALGPISTIVSGFQVYFAAAEYGDLKVLYHRLLETTEMLAYLNVLLKQYDGAITAHEEILDALWTEHNDYSRRVCEDPNTR